MIGFYESPFEIVILYLVFTEREKRGCDQKYYQDSCSHLYPPFIISYEIYTKKTVIAKIYIKKIILFANDQLLSILELYFK